MAFLETHNARLNPRYAKIARHYRDHGSALGLRWDYAFFQMLLETGYLTYKGDVRASQNNFAGLGATGGGVRGESFRDISTGVLAHLQHLKMYSGARVENPVADRTRKVQAWGVLTSWHKKFARPITFADAAAKWAPGSGAYVRDVRKIAQRFFEGPCVRPDPAPEQIAARTPPKKTVSKQKAPVSPAKKQQKPKQQPAVSKPSDPRAKKIAAASTSGPAPKAKSAAAKADTPVGEKDAKGLGFSAQGRALMAAVEANKPAPPATAKAGPKVKVLNKEADPPPAAAKTTAKKTAPPSKSKAAAATTAAKKKQPEGAKTTAWMQKPPPVSGAAKTKPKSKAKKKSACRVFTASYGGSKAIIIKAVADKTVNYTVLDVHEGSEKREADAYINAYAKGGKKIGEFANQPLALERAFELCPDG